MSEDIENIGENVDRLLSVDVNGRGRVTKLYPIARELQKRPLTLLAAEKLVERVKAGDYVVIATGIVMPGTLLPETDGPLGAAALARALDVGLAAKTLFLVDEPYVGMMEAVARAAGLVVLPHERLAKVRRGASVIVSPVEEEKAKKLAESVMAEYGPKAMIAVERRGPNEKGIYHSVRGFSMSEYEGKTGPFFDQAISRGILTIGIADGCGMESGFGKIKEKAKHLNPLYAKCTCPCGAGIANSTNVDTYVIMLVSNWGAYGVAACMSALLNNPDVLHNRDVELAMLQESVRHGAIDGIYADPRPWEDGMPGEISCYIVEIMRQIVKNGLRIGKR